jgi:hypothetical protein
MKRKLARFVELELCYEGYSVNNKKLLTAGSAASSPLSERVRPGFTGYYASELSGMEVLRRIRRISSVPVINANRARQRVR